MARHDLGGTVRERDAAATLAWIRPFLQSRLTHIAGSRDDMYPASYEPGNPAAGGTPGASPTRDFRRAITPPMGTTFEEDLQITRGLLREAGMDRVAAVDLTHPEIGIPVVMAVVPGMRETDGH